MPKLTKTVVEAVPVPSQQPAFAWDDRISGFGVKVLPSGSRKYILKYRVAGGRGAQQRWLSIGTHGAITADQARAFAQQASAKIAAGADPQRERQAVAKQPTLTQLWEEFVKSELPLKKAATQRDYTSLWQRLIKPKLGAKRVQEITRREVGTFHKGLASRPYQANRALAVLSRLMNLAEKWDWRQQGTNPCKFVGKFKESSRERYLNAEEIANVSAVIKHMSATGEITPDAGNLLILLLLTGARKSELANAEWEWVGDERKVITLPDSKTGPRPLYISDAAAVVLERQRTQRDGSKYIFPGRDRDKPIHNLRKPWLRVCEAAGLSGIRIHDLRHTAASIAVGKGVSLAVIGRLLGHTQPQTTQRYAHLADDPALHAANLIGNAVHPKPTEDDAEESEDVTEAE